VPANEAAEAALERREVRPTTVAIVRAGEEDGPRMEAFRWGVQPAWSRRPLLNARSDKLASSRLWRRLAGARSSAEARPPISVTATVACECRSGSPPFLAGDCSLTSSLASVFTTMSVAETAATQHRQRDDLTRVLG
jgi:hypothetical protein